MTWRALFAGLYLSEALEVCEAAESAGQLKSTEGSTSVLDDIAAKYLDRLLSNGEATKAGDRTACS